MAVKLLHKLRSCVQLFGFITKSISTLPLSSAAFYLLDP